MHYPKTKLLPTIQIDSIISMFYFEFTKDYVFKGERHDFWEFLYVDKGEVEVTADTIVHPLRQGTIIFHKPNEFHSINANKVIAPNLVVMSFECHSEAMKHFENKVIPIGDEERNLLALIIEEGTHAFHSPFRIPLQRREEPLIGSEQLVQLYLSTFLIRLLRQMELPQANSVTKIVQTNSLDNSHQDDNSVQNQNKETFPVSSSKTRALSYASKEKLEEDYVHQLIEYMKQRLKDKPSLSEISEAVHLSQTRLQHLFKQKTGYSVMDYFGKMKIDQAKTYIREEKFNFTEIAHKLGFGSVHSFSKAFKKMTDMSPSEYAKSVKARVHSSEGSNQPVPSPPFVDHCQF